MKKKNKCYPEKTLISSPLPPGRLHMSCTRMPIFTNTHTHTHGWAHAQYKQYTHYSLIMKYLLLIDHQVLKVLSSSCYHWVRCYFFHIMGCLIFSKNGFLGSTKHFFFSAHWSYLQVNKMNPITSPFISPWV